MQITNGYEVRKYSLQMIETEQYDKELKLVYARNRQLEAENQILEFKVNALLDMVASSFQTF